MNIITSKPVGISYDDYSPGHGPQPGDVLLAKRYAYIVVTSRLVKPRAPRPFWRYAIVAERHLMHDFEREDLAGRIEVGRRFPLVWYPRVAKKSR